MFWHSTTHPPDTKPSKTFHQLKNSPEVFSWLTQLCTMDGSNMYYYSCFNITNRDWDCECGDATQVMWMQESLFFSRNSRACLENMMDSCWEGWVWVREMLEIAKELLE